MLFVLLLSEQIFEKSEQPRSVKAYAVGFVIEYQRACDQDRKPHADPRRRADVDGVRLAGAARNEFDEHERADKAKREQDIAHIAQMYSAEAKIGERHEHRSGDGGNIRAALDAVAPGHGQGGENAPHRGEVQSSVRQVRILVAAVGAETEIGRRNEREDTAERKRLNEIVEHRGEKLIQFVPARAHIVPRELPRYAEIERRTEPNRVVRHYRGGTGDHRDRGEREVAHALGERARLFYEKFNEL